MRENLALLDNPKLESNILTEYCGLKASESKIGIISGPSFLMPMAVISIIGIVKNLNAIDLWST